MSINELANRVDWDRIIAIQQFMTAATFLPAFFQIIIGIYEGQEAHGAINLTLAFFFAILNLTSAWQLLDKSRVGYLLSFLNACGQVFIINTSMIGFIYHGPIWTGVGVLRRLADATKFDFGIYFSEARIAFALGAISNVVQVFTIDLVALAAAIYLFKKLRRFKSQTLQ